MLFRILKSIYYEKQKGTVANKMILREFGFVEIFSKKNKKEIQIIFLTKYLKINIQYSSRSYNRKITTSINTIIPRLAKNVNQSKKFISQKYIES